MFLIAASVFQTNFPISHAGRAGAMRNLGPANNIINQGDFPACGARRNAVAYFIELLQGQKTDYLDCPDNTVQSHN